MIRYILERTTLIPSSVFNTLSPLPYARIYYRIRIV